MKAEIMKEAVTQNEFWKKASNFAGYEISNDPAAMPATKISGFFKEFPEIAKITAGEKVSSVFVSRITPLVISRELIWFKVIDFVLGADDYTVQAETVYLLDDKYKIVKTSVEVQPKPRKRFFLIGPTITPRPWQYEVVGKVCHPDTVGNKLVELGEEGAQKVKYVLSLCKGVLILYKSPKDLSIPEWIEQQIEKERWILRGQVQEIENETM